MKIREKIAAARASYKKEAKMSISKYLQEECGIPDATPGKKCICPTCGHKTFSIKSDDSIVKCFHPGCTELITLKQLGNSTDSVIARLLKQFYKDTHEQLIKMDNNAYRYLLDARRVHPKIVKDAMLGIVPSNYNIDILFNSTISKIEENIGKQREKLKEEKSKKEIISIDASINSMETSKSELMRYKGKFKQILDKFPGWLILFHTDSSLNITKLRLRKPFDKKFATYKFSDTDGVFGVNLYDFVKGEEEKEPLIVVEGEFNLLRFQSVGLQQLEDEGEDLNNASYFNCVSIGSADSPDLKTVKNLNQNPIICYDNDDAGFSVVTQSQELMHVSAFTVPKPADDLDEFIERFGEEYVKALIAIQELIAGRMYFYRFYKPVIEEMNIYRRLKMKDFEISRNVTEILLNDLRQRGMFYYDGKTSYLFNHQNKILNVIHSDNLEHIRLLNEYKFNRSESLFKYLTNEMMLEAINNGTRSDIHRFAYYEKVSNTLYLYNNAGMVYRISKDTTELVDNGTAGILFVHNPNAEPFELVDVEKTRGIFFDKIINKINFDLDNKLTKKELQELIKCWIFSIFFESVNPTKPIVAFVGEKGSGKSSTFKGIGITLFGKQFDVMNVPEKQDDLDVTLLQETLVVLDNADSKVAWLEDRLATVATGAMIKKRKLYSDSDVIVMQPHCFVGITSRSPHFRRDDVAERTLLFKVARLPFFKSEHEILSDIYQHRNEILSDIVMMLQELLDSMDSDVSYSGDVRMADFANFMFKASKADGTHDIVKSILAKLPGIQAEFSLEVDPLVDLLILWCEKNLGRFVTYEELLEGMTKIADDKKIDFFYKNKLRPFANKMASLKSTLEKLFDIEEESKGGHKIARSYTLKSDSHLY